MNLDPMKPIGAFIENTIRPILGELKWFFDECEKKGIPINETNIRGIISYVARAHFNTCVVNFIQNILICVIICITWLISLK